MLSLLLCHTNQPNYIGICVITKITDTPDWVQPSPKYWTLIPDNSTLIGELKG